MFLLESLWDYINNAYEADRQRYELLRKKEACLKDRNNSESDDKPPTAGENDGFSEPRKEEDSPSSSSSQEASSTLFAELRRSSKQSEYSDQLFRLPECYYPPNFVKGVKAYLTARENETSAMLKRESFIKQEEESYALSGEPMELNCFKKIDRKETKNKFKSTSISELTNQHLTNGIFARLNEEKGTLLKDSVQPLTEIDYQSRSDIPLSTTCDSKNLTSDGKTDDSTIVKEISGDETRFWSATDTGISLYDSDSELSELELVLPKKLFLRPVGNTRWERELTATDMYEKAFEAVERKEVTCRKIRKDLVNVETEEEFLTKVYCLRKGFQIMFEDEAVSNWMADCVRSMLVEIINMGDCWEKEKEEENVVERFEAAFEYAFKFYNDYENWPIIKADLSMRQVFHTSFYDVTLCFLLLDFFEDIENPRRCVNRSLHSFYLTNKYKRKVVVRTAFEELKDMQYSVHNQSNFIYHMYEVFSYILPTMVWGLHGPNLLLKQTCERIDTDVKNYVRCLFSSDHVRYTSPVEMAEDILKLTKHCLENAKTFLEAKGQEKIAADKRVLYQQCTVS